MTSITIREKDNKTVLEARVKVSEKDSQNFRKLAVTHYQNDPTGNLYGTNNTKQPIYFRQNYRMFLHTSQGKVSAYITLFGSKLVTQIKGEKKFVYDFHTFLENIS